MPISSTAFSGQLDEGIGFETQHVIPLAGASSADDVGARLVCKMHGHGADQACSFPNAKSPPFRTLRCYDTDQILTSRRIAVRDLLPHETPPTPGTSQTLSDSRDEGLALLQGDDLRPQVMADFRKHLSSVLIGVFAGALLDEPAMVPVAASLNQTGRFTSNFIDRGIQSGFGLLPCLVGGRDQRKAGSQWLKEQHKVVRGTGTGEYEGIRYSALDPELWVWIIASGINMSLRSFPLCTGKMLRRNEKEAAYQYLRYLFADLELPGAKGKLPRNFDEFTEYYDHTVATKLQTNGLLRDLFTGLARLPMPTVFIPPGISPALKPAWLLVRPLVGRIIQICSAAIMHPELREMVGYKPRFYHNFELTLYTAILQLTWRLVPDRLLLEPVSYNQIKLDKLKVVLNESDQTQRKFNQTRKKIQRQQRRILNFYSDHRLEDFSPPARNENTCPFGG